MIINIQNNGKILKEKLNLKLPDFTILTGENGSGKTQLLEYLGNYFHIQIITNGLIDTNINPITDNELNILKDIIISHPGIKVNTYMHYESNSQQLIQNIKNQWIKLKDIAKSFFLIKDINYVSDLLQLDALNKARNDFQKSMVSDYNRFDESKFIKVQQNDLKILKLLEEKSSKKIYDLTLVDFITFYEVQNDLFSSSLDLLFHQFNLKQKYFSHLTENITAPWIVFNNILEKAEFKYQTEYNASSEDDKPATVTLIDKESRMKVDFDSLSSGEKTIIALIFVLYNASNNGKFPEVLLFDEPDAHLHPSLTKLFLNVIQDVLVKEQNVKVILTTHSPSTIALSPEESIFRMDRILGYPIKENKDKAVQSLSNGLASISIESGDLGIIYNIKQTSKHILFTEGITDKIILDIAWKKIYNNEEKPFFIQDCFDASFLGNLFVRGDDKQDGIFNQFPEKCLIALFDFDPTGYSCWNRDKKFIDIEKNPFYCLTKSYKNAHKILLPVPNQDNIRNLVIKDGQTTFEDKSNLYIESLFLNVPSFQEKYFNYESVVGGGNIYTFKGDKRKFAENLKDLDAKYFDNFKPLFEKIESIIVLPK
ncbi:hypothetical protein BA768_05615 [Chryseobacterium sp. CBo1]|uniref:ATP-binding protein n=1 Tax=Chryseobacterium sp. CBo1 TaxID=1869230 RepID=UPI000810DD12|nr:ATP-binding protein [Chryseobacterium sp. CBo1]OCK50106.1 hypothetical protein BA768_05615 [Chryseobacterium sp. CBo1]